MRNSQFCQQCAVHHQVQFHQGQTAFRQCERKVQQLLNNEQSKTQSNLTYCHSNIVLQPSQSYTSINVHFSPPKMPQSKTSVHFSRNSPRNSNIKGPVLNEKKVLSDLHNLQRIPSVKIKVLNPQISAANQRVTVKHEKLTQINAVFSQFRNILLGTIREERYQSEGSSSISFITANPETGYSTKSSFRHQTPQFLKGSTCREEKAKLKAPTYVFKNLKNKDEKANQSPNEPSCCCW